MSVKVPTKKQRQRRNNIILLLYINYTNAVIMVCNTNSTGSR